MKRPLLEVDNLHLSIHEFNIIHGISFEIYPGEIVGLVGESGCGKSLTASAILGLLPLSFHSKGRILFEGENLLNPSTRQNSSLGARLSIVLQDPTLALNPLVSIGKQLIEGLCYHKKIPYPIAFEKGVEWLTRVGIGDARIRMHQYPHEMSGGMKQRILIAMALICEPSLVIADEPTTALDVTVQAQILELLQLLQQQQRMSLLLITHDLGVIARCCQRVLVMYAGRLIETGVVEHIFNAPRHPYTQALLKSRRHLEQAKDESLFCLTGSPPPLHKRQPGCPFVPRCAHAMTICQQKSPPQEESIQGSVWCWLPEASRKSRKD